MLNFHNLKELIDILSHSYYVPHPAKTDLIELLEDMLELKGKKSPEEAIAILKSKIKNGLKSEMSNELKQKIGKLEQLKAENKDLQTKKDKAERLNRALEHANDRAHNENIELKNKLNIQIQQLRKESENKTKTIKQLTCTATISVGLAVGLVTFTALEHTTKLETWLIIGIATVSAFLVGDLASQPSSQMNGIQESQGEANESLVA